MTTEKEKLYAKARNALARVQGGEAKQVKLTEAIEAAKWEAAEVMARLSEMGESNRSIAKEVGCHHVTVGYYLAVWRGYGVTTNRPSFSEATGQVRDYQSLTQQRQQRTVPVEPDAKAAFVAQLLDDKEVADSPLVRQVQSRHDDRRLRQEAAEWNREHDIPTRTETVQEGRRLSVVQNASFWQSLLMTMKHATRAINDASNELERTGMPRSDSGEIIKAARSLTRAVEHFSEEAKQAAIGNALTN